MENKSFLADFATITSINGDAVVRRADGVTSTLSDGDRLSAGDVVITSPNASLEISVAGGGVLHLSKVAGDVLALDSAFFDSVGNVEDSSVSLDALNILLAHHSDTVVTDAMNDADVTLNLADMLADTKQEVFGANKHETELGALPSIDSGDALPSLGVSHWNHIDT